MLHFAPLPCLEGIVAFGVRQAFVLKLMKQRGVLPNLIESRLVRVEGGLSVPPFPFLPEQTLSGFGLPVALGLFPLGLRLWFRFDLE